MSYVIVSKNAGIRRKRIPQKTTCHWLQTKLLMLLKTMPYSILHKKPVAEVSNISTVEEIIDWMFDGCEAIGANKMSYHFYSEANNNKDLRKSIFSKGYPETWVYRYATGGLGNSDPIPDAVMKEGKVMTWGEALSKTELTRDEKAFVMQARSIGLIHGIGLPLWGPKECDAFVAVGFPDVITDRERKQISALQLLLQAGHQKICELISDVSPVPTLSKREAEILTWVARGKSNTDIATILGISADTVATYLQRIFAKLESRNRIGVAIRALRLGLIRI